MAKMIYIGDSRQQIYTWRGASDSFSLFKGRQNVKVMPMNISQRCSKAVCDAANQVFTDNPIEAKATAKAGKVSDINIAELFELVKPNDFILCRKNLPIIRFVFKLIKARIPARILGKDIGYMLINLLTQTVKDNGLEELSALAQVIQNNGELQCTLLTEQKRYKAADLHRDTYESLLTFFHDSKTVDEVKSKIEDIFTDDAKNVVLLSTIHRIKGLEADNVFILETKERKDSNAEENQCIEFVAITRAKANLYFVKTEKDLENESD